MVHDTPMLEMAPPLEHALRLVVRAAEGALDDVDRQAVVLREHLDGGAADVGPGGRAAVAEELRVDDLEAAAAHEDGAAAIHRLVAVERPCLKVMFWTVSVGWAWFWQWSVVQTRSGSQVFMYRMRRAPPPSSVTRPLPSMTTSGRSLNTLAVARHLDGHRLGAAVEADDAAARDRGHDLLRRAARGRAGADHPVRVRGVDRPRLGRDGGVAVRVAGRADRGRRSKQPQDEEH